MNNLKSNLLRLILLFVILLAVGCTINMTPQSPTEEKKVPAKIEMKQAEQSKHAPWPQDGKEYWYARYFHTMASHPGIQRRIKPVDVFAIVKCTMDKYEEDNCGNGFVRILRMWQYSHQKILNMYTMLLGLVRMHKGLRVHSYKV